MKQIDDLESRLGVRLFERSTTGVRLTPQGEIIYNAAQQLRSYATEQLNLAKFEGEKPVLRIGTSIMRPVSVLMELISSNPRLRDLFEFEILPIDDTQDGLKRAVQSLSKDLDLIISPIGFDSKFKNTRSLAIMEIPCCIAVPESHKLAHKEILTWDDIEGESMMLPVRGISPILDALRDEIITNHPSINIIDVADTYDLSEFNRCSKNGYIMETLQIWDNIHPMLVTIPFDWDYRVPYGVLHHKEPSPQVDLFLTEMTETLV